METTVQTTMQQEIILVTANQAQFQTQDLTQVKGLTQAQGSLIFKRCNLL
jgi:hypothetical protein